MKLRLSCRDCDLESWQNLIPPNIDDFYGAEITQSGIYRFKCEKGHENIIELHVQHFEMLFDLGVMALLDGYTRESVASFAASLERMYEFCIRLLLEKSEISNDAISETWKVIAKQSERQLGAFYFLYLNEFKTVPPVLTQNNTSFRNNIIHQGYIPDYSEVFKYGEQIYNYMITILKKIRTIENYFELYQKMILDQRDSYINKFNVNPYSIGGYGYPSSFEWHGVVHPASHWGNRSFNEVLSSMKSLKDIVFKK